MDWGLLIFILMIMGFGTMCVASLVIVWMEFKVEQELIQGGMMPNRHRWKGKVE